jgi:hypothetical protein
MRDAAAARPNRPSAGNYQNGADEYEDNDHAGEFQRGQGRAEILAPFARHGGRTDGALGLNAF